MPSPMMKWFEWGAEPVEQAVTFNLAKAAQWMDENLPDGPEKTVALRKMVEAKDAALRAAREGLLAKGALHPDAVEARLPQKATGGLVNRAGRHEGKAEGGALWTPLSEDGK